MFDGGWRFGVIPSRVARKRLISSEEGEEDEARDGGILRSLFGCLTRSHNFWQRECPKLVGFQAPGYRGSFLILRNVGAFNAASP